MQLLLDLTFVQQLKRVKQRENESVDIRLHRVIYKAIDEIEATDERDA